MNIGQRLKKAREKIKMSQDELSELTGISLSSIKNYENNRYDIPVKKLIQLSEVLKCNFMWLATGNLNDKKEIPLEEIELVSIFNALGENDKKESLDYIKFRYERSKKGEKLSHLNTTKKEKKQINNYNKNII